jgi:hypothetical protein
VSLLYAYHLSSRAALPKTCSPHYCVHASHSAAPRFPGFNGAK